MQRRWSWLRFVVRQRSGRSWSRKSWWKWKLRASEPQGFVELVVQAERPPELCRSRPSRPGPPRRAGCAGAGRRRRAPGPQLADDGPEMAVGPAPRTSRAGGWLAGWGCFARVPSMKSRVHDRAALGTGLQRHAVALQHAPALDQVKAHDALLELLRDHRTGGGVGVHPR